MTPKGPSTNIPKNQQEKKNKREEMRQNQQDSTVMDDRRWFMTMMAVVVAVARLRVMVMARCERLRLGQQQDPND